MLQNEQSLNFTVSVSRCWMARNLLGERKENRKEGCEGRKTDQQTPGEERELQKNTGVSLNFRKNTE